MFAKFVNIQKNCYICNLLFRARSMDIKFQHEFLSELYYTGKSKDKKHRFQPQIIRKYIRIIDVLKATDSVEELYGLHGLNYKVLQGDKAGIEAVRVNDQYRIEFKTSPGNNNPIITICNILDLSNHYK